MSYLAGNQEDRFSRDIAYVLFHLKFLAFMYASILPFIASVIWLWYHIIIITIYREMLLANNTVTSSNTDDRMTGSQQTTPPTAFQVKDVTYRAPKSKVNLCEGRFARLQTQE